MTFRSFCPFLILFAVAILAGCNRPRVGAPLPPEVEAYAVERTPAVYEKFQNTRAKLQRIEEGKNALLADLKKVNRNSREDPTMQQMLARQAIVEDEIRQLREFLESNYLSERKFLLGLTADGVPAAQADATIPKTVPNNAAQPAQNIRAQAPAISPTQEISATYQSSFIPENLKNFPNATPLPAFAGKVGDRCWLMDRYTIEVDGGLCGLKKGTLLRVIRIVDSFIVVVTDEKETFHVPASLLTTEKPTQKITTPALLTL